MENSVDRSFIRMASLYARRVGNKNIPTDESTIVASREKKSLSSSEYTRVKPVYSFIKAQKRQ